MNYEEITLNHLFRHPDLHSDIFSEIEMEDKVVRLKKEIQIKEPQLKWQKVLEEIIGASLKLLDTKLKDILEGGWEKYNEVNKFLERVDFSDDETFMVPLVEHTITSEHHPKIEIRLGEIYVGAIDFELQLQLVLSGIILKISNHKIQSIKAGICTSSGYFSCEGVVIFEDEESVFEF
jgi:pterin-4a-carbinolamine dehydratase